MRSAATRLILASLIIGTLAACSELSRLMPTPGPTPPRPLGPGEVWVPFELWEPIDGVPVLCGGGGFVGEYRLHGSPIDSRLVWMTVPDGSRQELAWPLGYSARFTPELELLDQTGSVIGREGTLITGGCGTPQEGIMWVELER